MFRELDELAVGLGWDDYQSYTQSKLFRLIRGVVLKRDGVCSRSPKCQKKASQVFYLASTPTLLMGANTAGLTCFCDRCMKEIQTTAGGNRRTWKESLRAAFHASSGIPYRGKDYSPAVGRWFMNRRIANYPVLRELIGRIQGELPEWYETHQETFAYVRQRMDAVEAKIRGRAPRQQLKRIARDFRHS